jgi:hypothetical protein
MNEKEKLERRAFNEALRARMRLIAAQRGVPDDHMTWLGRIRHYDLVKFVRKHDLDWRWVLPGVPGKAPPQRPELRIIQGGLR